MMITYNNKNILFKIEYQNLVVFIKNLIKFYFINILYL